MEESDRLPKLKPSGELKVVTIPFSGKVPYAFDIRPGNSVWGKTWRPTPFDGRVVSVTKAPIQEKKEPEQVEKTPIKDKEMNLIDRFSKNSSHVIIGLGILLLMMLFARRQV